MRARNAIVLIASALSLFAPPARAGIEQFVDDHTALAGQADLTKADADALDKWITQAVQAANLLPAAGPGPNQATLAAGMREMKRWLTDAKVQGATMAYMVANDDKPRGSPFVFIVPTPDDAKTKAMASLLFSGTTTGPTAPGEAQRQWQQFIPRAEAVPGVGAVMGIPDRLTMIKAIKPKPRPELTAAFASAADAPVKLAIIPTANLAATMKGAPMPVITLFNNTKWAVASVALPPTPVVTVTIQAKDAEAAKQTQQMLVAYATMAVASGVGLTPQFGQLMAPTIKNDQVVLTLDEKQLVALAGELKGPMQRAREQALHVASSSNIRQLLQGCMLYRNDNKNVWPDDLKALEKYVKVAQVFTNPAKPDQKPGYVYVKPVEPIADPSAHAVIYEAHKEFGGGVNVGFADGHVEFVADKDRFNGLIAALALQ